MSDHKECLTVGDVRAALANHADDAPIFVQTVGTETGAWYMALRISTPAHFRAGTQPVFTAWHPEMKHLPMSEDIWTRDHE